MGKSKKSRKVQNFRADPVNNGTSHSNGSSISNGSAITSILDTIAAQLQSVNPEDKVCACHSIGNLSDQEEARAKIVEKKFARMCAPFLMESDSVVVGAALGCLYNLSCQGPEVVHHLVSQDILTPLLTLISQFGGIVDVSNKQKKIESEKIIEDSFNLLWNLLQEDTEAIEVFNRSQIIQKLTPFMSSIVSPSVRVSCLSLLVTSCEGNAPAQEVISEHLDNVANIVSNSDEDNLVRITAALLLVTACNDKQKIMNNQSLSLIFQCVSQMLDFKAVTSITEIPKFEKKYVTNITNSLKAQLTALEILTNLASLEEDGDLVESDEDFDDNDDGFSSDMEDGNEIEASSEVKLFTEFFAKSNMLSKVLESTVSLPTDVKMTLLGNESGKMIYSLHEKLLIDSYLCLSNITEIMTLPQLGGGESIKNIWMNLCSILCSKPDNLDLVDALSSCVRSLTNHVCHQDAGVSLENVGVNDLEQLVTVFSAYNTEESSNTRTNIVNILGNFGCVATRNITDQQCIIIVTKLSSWILDVVLQDASLRVALEGLDKLMDVFSEDDTDQVFANLNLLRKLQQISSLLKSRIKKERKSLADEDLAVASTVKLNLQRFIGYKEKRLKQVS